MDTRNKKWGSWGKVIPHGYLGGKRGTRLLVENVKTKTI